MQTQNKRLQYCHPSGNSGVSLLYEPAEAANLRNNLAAYAGTAKAGKTLSGCGISERKVAILLLCCPR